MWKWMVRNRLPALSLLVGAALGAAISWWWAQPPTPWIKFEWLVATYKEGSDAIELRGAYVVHRACPVDKAVIWRTEALATDGQIAIYGPKPNLPPLDEGYHQYSAPLSLLHGIKPDGWRSTVIATCPGERPETVPSPSASVQMKEEDMDF